MVLVDIQSLDKRRQFQSLIMFYKVHCILVDFLDLRMSRIIYVVLAQSLSYHLFI